MKGGPNRDRVRAAVARAPQAVRNDVAGWWSLVSTKDLPSLEAVAELTETWLVTNRHVISPLTPAYLWAIVLPPDLEPREPSQAERIRAQGCPLSPRSMARQIGAVTGEHPARVLRAQGVEWALACKVAQGRERQVPNECYRKLRRAWAQTFQEGAYQLPLSIAG